MNVYRIFHIDRITLDKINKQASLSGWMKRSDLFCWFFFLFICSNAQSRYTHTFTQRKNDKLNIRMKQGVLTQWPLSLAPSDSFDNPNSKIRRVQCTRPSQNPFSYWLHSGYWIEFSSELQFQLMDAKPHHISNTFEKLQLNPKQYLNTNANVKWNEAL